MRDSGSGNLLHDGGDLSASKSELRNHLSGLFVLENLPLGIDCNENGFLMSFSSLSLTNAARISLHLLGAEAIAHIAASVGGRAVHVKVHSHGRDIARPVFPQFL